MNELFLVAFVLMFGITLFAAFWYGHSHAQTRDAEKTVQNIRDYLDHTIPNEWTAYKTGVNEGYEQGLRDKEKDPNEPA